MRCPDCSCMMVKSWRINIGAGPQIFCEGCAASKMRGLRQQQEREHIAATAIALGLEINGGGLRKLEVVEVNTS